MKLNHQRVVLTGATGGIGQLLAIELATRGAEVAIVGTDKSKLNQLAADINAVGGKVHPIVANLNHPDAPLSIVTQSLQMMHGVDLLINNAGILDFTAFEHESTERIQNMVTINVTAPILLTRLLMPTMLKQSTGMIVNIGSILGAIAFPHYATYSATKYALRGFSEALRRELSETSIKVCYVAPRAVNTSMNDELTRNMMLATKMHVDEPEVVVAAILNAIEKDKAECSIGQPESFFAWLNGVFPRLVGFGIKNEVRIARKFAIRTES